MNKCRPAPYILVWCALSLPAQILTVQMPVAMSAAVSSVAPDKPADNPVNVLDNSNLPKGVLDLMRASQMKYLEGSSLIKTGDTDKAREAFDEAVDLLLQSDWDLKSTAALNAFFQDLIQRIKSDESLYLFVPSETEDDNESAVADELNDLDLIPITVDPALQDALIADLAKTKYEIPITINEMVVKSLDFWLNQGRKHFVDGLLRSGQYRPIIEKIFREEEVPLDLMYLAQVESLFKPHAYSRAKAKGIWQFEKGTAIRYGLKVTRDVDERSDPEKSTRAAARYLSDLFSMFQDWNLALAAYNWGEGKVRRLIESTGMKDFWQLVDLKRKLPAETKNHVPLIQASVILARNAERYGLPTKLNPPLQYAEVSVSKPIDLRAAAKVLCTSIDELKKLNPALRGLTTPANYPNFQLKVPVGSNADIQEKLAALPKARIKPPPDYDGRHKVRPGETLSGIAARYRVSIAELMKVNNLASRNKLAAGIWLDVPSRSSNPKKALNSKLATSSANSSKSAARRSGAQKQGSALKKNQSSARAGSGKAQTESNHSNGKVGSAKDKIDSKTSSRQIASK